MASIEQLEQQKTKALETIERRDIAVKLAGNRDFRKLILEYFCVEECARYARESGDPALTEAQRADALNMAQAAGHLKRFLSLTIMFGDKCREDMSELEEMMDEVRAEDAIDLTPIAADGAE